MRRRLLKYRYYNRRPDGLEIEDCVCRAISTATGLEYYTVDDLLNHVSDKNACDKLCINCYNHLLEDVFQYTWYDGYDMTVREVINNHPNDILILRLDGHLTCAKYGILLDIWNCSKRIVDCFWIVE